MYLVLYLLFMPHDSNYYKVYILYSNVLCSTERTVKCTVVSFSSSTVLYGQSVDWTF